MWGKYLSKFLFSVLAHTIVRTGMVPEETLGMDVPQIIHHQEDLYLLFHIAAVRSEGMEGIPIEAHTKHFL